MSGESRELLAAAELRRSHRAESFSFERSDEIEEPLEIVGQERAVEAIEFGMGIRREGYNLYALGPKGVGKYDLVDEFLKRQAAEEEPPGDWCYVHNFDKGNEPRALELPAGRGKPFAADMDELIEELKAAIPAAFESEDYQTRKQAIDEEFQERQEKAFEEVNEKAAERDITILRTPAGIALAPVKDGEVVPPGEFEALPVEEREEVEEAIDELQSELQEALKKVPQWERERRERVKELNQDVMEYAIEGPIDELRADYEDVEVVQQHLGDVQEHIVENAQGFLEAASGGGGGGGGGGNPMAAMMGGPGQGGPNGPNGPNGPGQGGDDGGGPGGAPRGLFRRYKVNVLVDHGGDKGAPVVYEDQPSLDHLTGRVEYVAQFGALLTDFNLIRPGALHRANGGYLILDARKVLMQPFAWEQLKRVLQSGEITIESRQQMMGLANTMSLEPEPIPLDVKVVLLGERRIYYLLSQLDPEFPELFKVAADFEHDMARNGDSEEAYARYLAGLIREEELTPFGADAIGRVCDRSSREAGDQERFSTHAETMRDLLRESDYWAQERGAGVVAAEDVDRAIEAKKRRNSRIRDRMYEQIERDTILIDTEGRKEGQVNGLSVLQLGQFRFGKPNRITARVRMGKGEVVDIEREVDLGGSLHSKGVLIISGYLGARFAREFPLSLSASLVFEQSYGRVDGDSASLAELCALKSALSGLGLAQNIAMTGSVNQHGKVQAIGGVNEKIEGFFDICQAQGLTGEQGVIIPASNREHLMLRRDVVKAVEEGQFSVWAVDEVDQAMTILTGVEAGERDEEGAFDPESVNGMVEARLRELAEQALAFSSKNKGES